MDESDATTNNLLSQSYTQSLERISQHKEKLGYPKVCQEKIEEREKSWNKLFEKYSKELSDDIEINLNSPSEDDDVEEDNDEEEKNNDKCFSKSRTPMRKSAALVQYWVDTGNPPYKLMDQLSMSDSGTSLSEEDCGPKHKIYPLKSNVNSPKKVRERTSNYSSVDTAAYILSNTNITKKAETMVIVEGSRKPKDSLETNKSRQSEFNLPINENSNENDEICDNNNVSMNKSHDTSLILSKLEETILEKSLNRSRLNSCASDDSEDSEIKATLPSSMRITDVLPTLEQYDKLMTKSTVDRLKDSEVGSGDSSGRATPKSFSLSKKNNRRKLYTGRNSPMDIIVSSTMNIEDPIVPKARNLHPAFQGTPKVRVRVSSLKKRATLNARRQSKLFFAPEPSQNSKDSSEPVYRGKEEKFLRTLGLVPSPSFNTRTKRKVISGIAKRRGPRHRQMRKMRNQDVDSNTDEGESSDSSLKSSIPDEESTNLLSLCTKKLLTISLEKLSNDVLRRLDEKNSSGEKIEDKSGDKKKKRIDQDFEKEKVDKALENGKLGGDLCSKLDVSPMISEIISSKKMKNSQFLKIELDSQESDQSTIIMVDCRKKPAEFSAPLTRSKKPVIDSEKPQEAGKNEESTPTDEKEYRKPLSTPQTRSKKSFTDSEIAQDAVENKKPVAKDEKPSAPHTKSRQSISDSDKPPEIVEKAAKNEDLTVNNGKIKKKLNNRTIRMLRSRSARKNAKKELKKRKSRKVNATKVRIKRLNNNNELLDEMDSSMKDSTAPAEDQESQDGEDDEEETENGGKKPLTINVTIDSDSYSDSSRDKKPRRPVNEIKRRFLKPIITFSSGDESDFITKMEKSADKFERKFKKKSTKADAPTEHRRKIIGNLMGPTVQLSRCTIVDSDEEEIIERSKVEVKSRSLKKKKNGTNNLGKSASTVKSPEKSTRSSKRLSIVRVLSFDDTSSKQSEEINESPPKKFKTETGVVNKHNSNNIQRTINKSNSSKDVESDSNASSSESMLLGRSTRSSGIKRKADFEVDCVQGRTSTDVKKSPVTRPQSPIKLTKTLTPVVKLLRESPVDKLASLIKSPTKKPQLVIKSPDKRLSSPNDKLPDIKLMDLNITIEKIPKDLEKSLKKNSQKSSQVVSPIKPINRSRKLISSVRKNTRSSKKRPLTSDDDSSVDFYLHKSTENNDKLINNDSSDIDSTKCTALFHNPFEDSGEELTISLNTKYERNRSSKNVNINLRKKSVMTFRTRDDSDSDD